MECDNVNPKNQVLSFPTCHNKKHFTVRKSKWMKIVYASFHITCPFGWCFFVKWHKTKENEILLGSILFIVTKDFSSIFLYSFSPSYTFFSFLFYVRAFLLRFSFLVCSCYALNIILVCIAIVVFFFLVYISSLLWK